MCHSYIIKATFLNSLNAKNGENIFWDNTGDTDFAHLLIFSN